MEHFESLVEDLDTVPDNPNSDQFNDLQIAESLGLRIAGLLIGVEILNQEPLKYAFGAGYEVATLVGEKFQKLDDFTNIFWQCRMDDDGMGVRERQFSKSSYFEDILTIRTAEFSKDKKTGVRLLDRDAIHVIPPIYKEVTWDNMKSYQTPSMNSKHMCNHFFVIRDKQILAIRHQIEYIREGNPRMKFIEQDDQLIFGVDRTWLEPILAEIQKEGRELIRQRTAPDS